MLTLIYQDHRAIGGDRLHRRRLARGQAGLGEVDESARAADGRQYATSFALRFRSDI